MGMNQKYRYLEAIWTNRITEYSKQKGTQKGHQVQLWSERPIGDWAHAPRAIITML